MSEFVSRQIANEERKKIKCIRTSGIKERDIDDIFHEWEENLQTFLNVITYNFWTFREEHRHCRDIMYKLLMKLCLHYI